MMLLLIRTFINTNHKAFHAALTLRLNPRVESHATSMMLILSLPQTRSRLFYTTPAINRTAGSSSLPSYRQYLFVLLLPLTKVCIFLHFSNFYFLKKWVYRVTRTFFSVTCTFFSPELFEFKLEIVPRIHSVFFISNPGSKSLKKQGIAKQHRASN